MIAIVIATPLTHGFLKNPCTMCTYWWQTLSKSFSVNRSWTLIYDKRKRNIKVLLFLYDNNDQGHFLLSRSLSFTVNAPNRKNSYDRNINLSLHMKFNFDNLYSTKYHKAENFQFFKTFHWIKVRYKMNRRPFAVQFSTFVSEKFGLFPWGKSVAPEIQITVKQNVLCIPSKICAMCLL